MKNKFSNMLAGLEQTLIKQLEKVFILFLCVYALLVVCLHGRHPMELWDESRIANNALAMAMDGHWMISYYNGSPDHWNTKPLLLIWIIAGLIRSGLEPMTALRLPSAFASILNVLIVYLFCRSVLRRPMMGVISALLLMSSTLFFGAHMAINGDYDSLLCLLTTCYCLSFWVYVENIDGLSLLGIVIAGVTLVLAILTKGIAAVLLLPGVLLYVLLRRRFISIVRDYRFWIALFGVATITILYYTSRNAVDPGYIHAVWGNELTGRYTTVNEGHQARTLHYVRVLLEGFEPTMLLFPAGILVLMRRSLWGSRIRAISVFCAVTSLLLLLVLTKSQTKIDYYCAPALPLMAIFVGIGVVELKNSLGELTMKKFSLNGRLWPVATVGILICTSCWAIYLDEGPKRLNHDVPQSHYGIVLRRMEQLGIKGPITIVDQGLGAEYMFPYYNPIAVFYAKEASFRGVFVRVQDPGQQIDRERWVASCNSLSLEWIKKRYELEHAQKSGFCLFGETTTQ